MWTRRLLERSSDSHPVAACEVVDQHGSVGHGSVVPSHERDHRIAVIIDVRLAALDIDHNKYELSFDEGSLHKRSLSPLRRHCLGGVVAGMQG